MRNVIVVAAVCLAACGTVREQQYRNRAPSAKDLVSVACLQQDEDYRQRNASWTVEQYEAGAPQVALAAIEFRDNGETYANNLTNESATQYTYVMKRIRELTGDTKRGTVIVAFIHGWKNNADLCNGNVSCFREVVSFLARREAKLPASSQRHIIGLYLGWRGLTSESAVPKNLSFWNRKATAKTVGEGFCLEWNGETCARPAGVRAALDELQRIYVAGKGKHDNSRLVLVGHSFGAQVLFAAVRDQIAESLKRDDVVEGIGDLAVLVNPAFEAAQYADHYRLIHARTGYRQQHPVLVTVSTSNDLPTHILFPLGQFLALRWGDDSLTTIGNYRPYYTHRLVADPQQGGLRDLEEPPDASCRPHGERECLCKTDLSDALRELSRGTATRSLELSASTARLTVAPECGSGRFGSGAWTTRLDAMGGVPCTPLWNVHTNGKVLDGHSGIFNGEFASFLTDLVARADEEIRARGVSEATAARPDGSSSTR